MNEIPLQVKGRYKLTRVNAETGLPVWESDWFDNLITDVGLDHCGASVSSTTICIVGSGTATPQVTDQKINIFVAGTTTNGPGGTNYTNSTEAPWWGGYSRTWRFGQGAAAGNLSEVGVGWGTATAAGHTLFSRALILDGNGNPTTITVLANEFLDVTYDFRMYLPANDVTFNNIEVFGNLHKFTIRGFQQAAAINQGGLPNLGQYMYTISAYRGFALGPITASAASGTVITNGTGSTSILPYVSNSLEIENTAVFGLTAANHADGISGFTLVSNNPSNGRTPHFQVLVEPPIKKTASDTLTFNFKWKWGRRP